MDGKKILAFSLIAAIVLLLFAVFGSYDCFNLDNLESNIGGEGSRLPSGLGLAGQVDPDEEMHVEPQIKDEDNQILMDPSSCVDDEFFVENVGCVVPSSVDYAGLAKDQEKCEMYQGVYYAKNAHCLSALGDDDSDGYVNLDEVNSLGTNPEDYYSPITCGMTLENDDRTYELSSDLDCFDENAIVIEANSVTLDCNGYTVTEFDSSLNSVGILVNGDDVNVQNCDIESFKYGIKVFGSDPVIKNNNLIFNSDIAIYLAGTGGQYSEATVEDNVIYGSYDGVRQSSVFFSNINDNTINAVVGIFMQTGVMDSVISENDITFSTYGIRMLSVEDVIVVDNIFSDGSASGTGINIEGSSSDLELTDNEICDVYRNIYCSSSVSSVTSSGNTLAGVSSCTNFVSSSDSSNSAC